MPLYEYRCMACGDRTDVYRHLHERDEPMGCCRCGSCMERQLPTIQRPISRPWGYNLRPGDKGYWSFEGHPPRPQIAPGKMAEDYYRNPPKTNEVE